MKKSEFLSESLSRLISHIESNNYKGYDPYDGLTSPLFGFPVLKSNKTIRFVSQQLIKRSPVNLRPFLAIPRGYNPVTLGLCLQGYTYLLKNSSSSLLPLFPSSHLLERINFLISELKTLITPGYHGACWGYDFPWEARYASIPAYGPTVVATGIITNALFTAYQITGSKECAEMIESSTDFVLHDLNKSQFYDSFIYSYSPYDRQQVLNASMKGVRLLAQAYSLNRNKFFAEEAEKAVRSVIVCQREDGSWPYSLASTGNWTDNYHTGYVLDCLEEYIRLTEDAKYQKELIKGYDFYKTHFVSENGIPRLLLDRTFPADCTSASQTILTLTRFGDLELSDKVASWIVQNMQSPKGYFFYRKFKKILVRTDFMRWSDAWMFTALAFLISHEQGLSSDK